MISTHILDINLGSPAAEVKVVLEKQMGNSWDVIGDEKTNADGRITYDCSAEAGTYRLNFYIEEYLKRCGLEPFFVAAPVTFKITETNRKYHVPLLLSPYGYSTYRGS